VGVLLRRRELTRQKCDAEYDRFQIEQPLIEMISRIINSYQIQDVSGSSDRRTSACLPSWFQTTSCMSDADILGHLPEMLAVQER
jgi:hypothetical protein